MLKKVEHIWISASPKNEERGSVDIGAVKCAFTMSIGGHAWPLCELGPVQSSKSVLVFKHPFILSSRVCRIGPVVKKIGNTESAVARRHFVPATGNGRVKQAERNQRAASIIEA